jgi:Ca-activated chloride channel family protein
MSAWAEAWTGLRLDAPWVLALAPVVLLLALLGSRTAALRFAPSAFLHRDPEGRARALPRSLRQRIAWLPRALHVLALLALVLALARPLARVALPLTRQGIDILLCLDVSSSMRADDLRPGRTRLDVTKAAALAFVEKRPDDRIGLVTFARYPDVVCPPTLDHGALAALLQGVMQVEEDSDEDATGIGMALARAAQALRRGGSASKVVVLLTDGEENVARADAPEEIAPLEAARLCEELGVRVYTIAAGIGRRTADGQEVEIDTRPVQEVASLTGGAFFAARDASAVERVYEVIDELERSAFDAPRYREVERFLPFLLLALALLLLARAARVLIGEALP